MSGISFMKTCRAPKPPGNPVFLLRAEIRECVLVGRMTAAGAWEEGKTCLTSKPVFFFAQIRLIFNGNQLMMPQKRAWTSNLPIPPRIIDMVVWLFWS